MTNLEVHTPGPVDLEGDLESLHSDCARMAAHWSAPDRITALPVSPSLIHGVTVPARSAHLLDAMSDYGD